MASIFAPCSLLAARLRNAQPIIILLQARNAQWTVSGHCRLGGIGMKMQSFMLPRRGAIHSLHAAVELQRCTSAELMAQLFPVAIEISHR